MHSLEIFPFVKSNKSLLSNDAISMRITITNHILELCGRHLFMKFLGHLQEVISCYEAFIVLVNILENSLNIFVCVIFTRLLSHKLNELLELNLPSIISIENRHSDVNKSSSWLISTILSDSFSKIKRRQHTIMIIIQEIKDLLEDFYVSDTAFGNNVLFRIKVNVLFGHSKR